MNCLKSASILILNCILFFYSCKEDSNYVAVPDIFISNAALPNSKFLGDNQCKTCHLNEFREWQGSHHDKAMQEADSTSVLGSFENTIFNSQGVTSTFFKKNGDYFVNTEGPDGEYHDYKIIYTFGVTPLQQYIVAFPDGKYQCLRTAWDTEKEKWFDLYPDFKIVHSEWLHWSRGAMNWNAMCSDCHSTNVQKNYDSRTDSYETTFALINVSCEACHGPGKDHVEEVKRLGDNYVNSGLLKMSASISPQELVDQCARCHMRREQLSAFYNFEGTLLDHYFPQLIEEPQYHPDGQILDEVYVYGSFVQSKMYRNEVSCNDCHNSHSLELKFEGNALCAQCHSTTKYNAPSHHFHQMGTEGAMCINCHMPGKYYMGNDFRRDHSFRVPRPDQSVKYGTPNACINCHQDKTNEWAAEKFEQLFGALDSIHFSDKLIPGILGQPHADRGLIELIKDAEQTGFVRASAIKALSNYNIPHLIKEYLNGLNDISPLVRAASVDVLSDLNVQDHYKYLLPLLKDVKRSVRIKAFYALGTIDRVQIPEDYIAVYDKVSEEFDTYVDVNSDFVGGLLKKADYQLKKGDLHQAIALYEKALKIDNLNNQVRFNLANLYYQSGNLNEARLTFEKIIEQEPGFGPTYYSLALLLVELGDEKTAVSRLEKAKDLMPDNLRVYYNLGLLYNKMGENSLAERSLAEGLKLNPADENLLYALAYHYHVTGEAKKASNIALKLVNLYPNNRQYQEFKNSLGN